MPNATRTIWPSAAAFALFGLSIAAAQAPSQGSWTMKAALPAALAEVSVAAIDGKLHVMGGSVLGFTGPYHVAYDPAANRWRPRAPLPRSLDHMGSTVL